MKNTDPKLFRLSTDIVETDGALLNVRTGEMYQLDEVGRLIIEGVKAGNLQIGPDSREVFDLMVEEEVLTAPVHDPAKEFFHLQWHLLNRCNLSCTHCYDAKEKVSELNPDQMRRVVDDFVFFLKKMDVDGEISLTGGEPTLFEGLTDLIEYIKSRDIFVSLYILSNGVGFPDSLIPVLKKYSIGVQISLDGLEKEHDQIRGAGSFRQATDTIRNLVKEGIRTSVHYVLMKRNTGKLKDFIRYVDGLGVPNINFSTLVPIGPGAAEEMASPEELKLCHQLLADFQKEVKVHIVGTRPLWTLVGSKGFCPVGYKTLTIDAKGDILPCRRLPMRLGNVLEDPFLRVWFANPFLKKMRERDKYVKVCGSCKHAEDCGGCRAIAAAVNGDPFSADPSCWLLNDKGAVPAS